MNEPSDPGAIQTNRAPVSAVQAAAWRQLWRLLLQPLDDQSEQHEAASVQEAASEETHDASVHAPTEA